ncbi:NAD(P)H-binding protein [Corynebacterium glyciniphilum]|uniref:NAD(P)H-binding protein n=1 Tax=Corynebacterium glyciniphilum TaxID=1404244 RepID=UPI003DA18188
MILVTGAHGQLGSAILRMLGQQGVSAVGGSRTPAERIRYLDFDRPESIDLSTVETLVLVSAGYAEDDQVIARHQAVVNAAVRDGVGHVVYTSVVGSGDHLGFALAHRATERLIARSGLRWTFLRNGIYAELIGDLLQWTDAHTVEFAFGEGTITAVPREDLAEAAVVAASPEAHEGKIYELTGEPVDMVDLAEMLGVEHRPIGLGEYRARLLGTEGLLDFQPPMLASIASSVRHGFLADATDDVEGLLGRPAGSSIDVAARAASLNRPQ